MRTEKKLTLVVIRCDKIPPPWADMHGENVFYGVFAEIGPANHPHRFIFHPVGIWFCELLLPNGELTHAHEPRLVANGAHLATLEEESLIRGYEGYKNRAAEIQEIARQRLR